MDTLAPELIRNESLSSPALFVTFNLNKDVLLALVLTLLLLALGFNYMQINRPQHAFLIDDASFQN